MVSHASPVKVSDRLISAFSYLTVGWGGLLFYILFYFMKKKVSGFMQFNIFQSMFVSLLYFLCASILGFIFNIASHIPIIQIIVSWIRLIFLKPVFMDYSLIQIFVNFVLLYLIIFSLLGRAPKIYKISNLIYNSIR